MVRCARVTVVIPTRDEEKDIVPCLEAVAAQSVPLADLQVVVVDGGSRDATASRAENALDRLGLAGVVVGNPHATTPSNLNLGLEVADGEVLCRVDARSRIPPSYVETCVEILDTHSDIAVVGGAQVAEARPGAGLIGRAIARGLRNPYATGLARYRRRSASGATDTVYLGSFRTDQLREEGGWDERFSTNQDFELNQRMRATGTIWFDEDLQVVYVPRDRLTDLAHQYRRFGRWKGASWLEVERRVGARHLGLLMCGPLAVVAGLWAFRRRPVVTLVGVVAVGSAVERASPGSAPIAERLLSVVVAGTVAGAWWCGVVEQVVRFARGERLLAARPQEHAQAGGRVL